ncbi:MAG: DUF4231 domain-containing protein [Caldilineae bacterium]|nr:MAG: DUF4231 domain-containing protein [Caldilineae bacterium]
MPRTELTPYDIEFDNGNVARYLRAPKGAAAKEIVEALKIKKPSAVLTVIGGAKGLDGDARLQLRSLFSRGVARAVYERACLVVTGGTDFGIMQMMGQGIADRGRSAPCIGVVPSELVQVPGGPPPTEDRHHVPLEPHHSHFVLVEGENWGDETETMYRLVRHLAEGVPSVSILANGGRVAKKELLYCVRQQRPVIVLEGSGRLADEVAALWKAHQQAKKGEADPETQTLLDRLGKDPDMQEIIEEGKITLFPVTEKPARLESLIHKLLPTALIDDTDLLKTAWQQFAIFDETANRKSHQFRRMRQWILWVGILAVIFAVASSTMEPAYWGSVAHRLWPALSAGRWAQILKQGIHIIALLLPVTGSVLLAGANRFNPGENWVALRGGAEDIKKEIFRYRARVYPYDQQDRTEKLARKIEQIGNRVMGGNVNKHELVDYDGPLPPHYGYRDEGDDGFSPLDGDTYLKHRLQNQIDFFERKGRAMYGKIKRWQWGIYLSGGVGTFLGLLGLDAFIAITTSMGAALASYMEMVQAEATLRGYNETAQILRGIRARWISANATPLSPAQRQRAFHKMVEDTEHALVTERAGWIDEMNQALQEFQPQTETVSSGVEVPPSV